MKYHFRTIAACALIASVSAIYAADINISADIDPATNVTNIQNAITAAGPGGKVIFAAGTYTVNATILVDEQVTLEGPQANVDPRQYPYGGSPLRSVPASDSVEAIIDGGGSIANIVRFDADNVELNGLVVQNGTADLIDSLTASGPFANPAVRYCIVTGSSGDEGMQLRNTSGAVIEYNYIYDIAVGDGINLCCGVVDGTIRDNEIYNNGGTNGTLYVYYAGGINRNVQILRNFIDNNGAGDEGIRVGESDGADEGFIIKDNVLLNVAGDGIRTEVSEITITGNTIDSPGGDCVYIRSSTVDTDTVYINNNVLLIPGSGIYIEQNSASGSDDATSDGTLNWYGSFTAPAPANFSGGVASNYLPVSNFRGVYGTPVSTSGDTIAIPGSPDNDLFTKTQVVIPGLDADGFLTIQSAPIARLAEAKNAVEILLFNDAGAPTLSADATVTVEYDETTDAVTTPTNGSTAGTEDQMRLHVWNGSSWVVVPGTVDEVNNTVSGDVSGFSVFAAFVDPFASVDEWQMLDN